MLSQSPFLCPAFQGASYKACGFLVGRKDQIYAARPVTFGSFDKCMAQKIKDPCVTRATGRLMQLEKLLSLKITVPMQTQALRAGPHYAIPQTNSTFLLNCSSARVARNYSPTSMAKRYSCVTQKN